MINREKFIGKVAEHIHDRLSILDACNHLGDGDPFCVKSARNLFSILEKSGVFDSKAKADHVYRIFENVKNGDGATAQIDGVKISKCNSTGETDTERNIRDQLMVSIRRNEELETSLQETNRIVVSMQGKRIGDLEREKEELHLMRRSDQRKISSGMEENRRLRRQIEILSRREEELEKFIPDERARLFREKQEILRALVSTVEYVAPSVLLSAVEGWSWFDALKKHSPEALDPLAQVVNAASMNFGVSENSSPDGAEKSDPCEEWAVGEDAVGEDGPIGKDAVGEDAVGEDGPIGKDGVFFRSAHLDEKPLRITEVSPAGIRIVFDGPPSHASGRFVEVENLAGESVLVGKWIQISPNLWALEIRS